MFCFPGTNEEDEFYYESAELKELAFQLGEDPEELRDRVNLELHYFVCFFSLALFSHSYIILSFLETSLTGGSVNFK